MGATGGNPTPMTPGERAISNTMDTPEGPVEPKDGTTVLTRVYDDTTHGLRVTSSPGGGVAELKEAPRVVRVTTAAIAPGGTLNFTIHPTHVDDGLAIPNKIFLEQVVVVPSAATRFRVRLFGAATRALADPLWFENPYSPANAAIANHIPASWYVNRDGTNLIFGELAVLLGAPAASFTLYILFRDGR